MRRALVTGSVRGIGAAIVARLLEDGLDVVGLDRADGADIQLDVFSGELDSELFANFDSTPLAAASIAQVHAATLADGREVVVKVLRPGMRAARAAMFGNENLHSNTESSATALHG